MDLELSPESQEAIHKAKNAAQAIEVARVQQMESLGDMVQERVEHVLARGTEQEKSIILARVPYICQDIKNINATLTDILRKMDEVKTDLQSKDEKNEKKFLTQEQFAPYKWVFSLIGAVVVTTLIGALLTQILLK